MTRTTNTWTLILAVVSAVTIITALFIPALLAGAGASDGCGEYSYGFTGTRLLNDGISDVSGPYEIDLPAGTYTVTLVAHDHHDTQVDIPTQPGEQYVVELDSGYVSGASSDVPDDETLTTTVFTNQQIDASKAITVRHAGVPGINSVDVVCVGFTPETAAAPVVDPPTQDITDPVTIVRVPEVEEPAAEVPDDSATDEVVREDSATDPEVADDSSTDQVVPETSSTDEVVPEVKGVVEAPVAAQLAITGPGAHAKTMIMLGIVMVSLGGLLIRRERRLANVGR